MRIAELWRYPVKSLQGERLDAVRVTRDGLEGDRGWALFDVETGYGLTARRVPELLFASARVVDGAVEIVLPDGSVAAGDDALSDWLGRRVTLRASGADEDDSRVFEVPDDFEQETTSRWDAVEGAAAGRFHDSASVRVSLVSTATIGDWDRRRFRSNVLLDGEGEDALVGSSVVLGDVELHVGQQIGRCVMTTRPQPGGIERDLDVLRTIARERDTFLAVGALVTRGGMLRTGDVLRPA